MHVSSYQISASTAGTRSPPKPSTSQSTSALDVDDADQPALVRFARLKQRDNLQAARSLPDIIPNAPRASTSTAKPDKWSVKDTSVQIASAFHQAATTSHEGSSTSMQHTTQTGTWVPNVSQNLTHRVARSSSVEYEKETQSTANRRLGAPPPRVNRLSHKPVAKSTSLNHVPDSEGEDEQPSRRERGKSPFEHVVDVARSLAPTSFFLRSPSKEPENRSVNGEQQQNQSSSYDYSAEEREYQAQNQASQPASRRGNVHRRNRMSVDNKAYRPSNSDLEESDEDFDDEGGKRSRRRKGKKGTGGPLTTLPVAGYDKRRKRRKGGKTNGGNEEDEEGSSGEQEEEQQEQSRVSEQQRSVRGVSPLVRAPSVARSATAPPSRMSVPRQSAPPPDLNPQSDPDTSMDVEQGLDSIQEIDEPPEVDDEHIVKKSFSFGATLGRTVHWVIAVFWGTISGVISVLSFIVDLLLLKPVQTIQSNSFSLIKYGILALAMYAAWQGLQSGINPLDYLPSLPALPTLRSAPTTPYQPPDVPPADVTELSIRLQRLESAISSLSHESQRSIHYIEDELKHQSEFSNRLASLETNVHKENVRAQDVVSKIQTAASRDLQTVKHEMDVLRAQLQAEHKETESRLAKTGSDKEARAQLKAFEDRLLTVEWDAKEAMEHARKSAKVDLSSGASLAWLSNLVSGKESGVTIKSTDGQDVTSLINLLVDSAVTRFSKDTLARVDFAMHSGGARIIPSLTSDTFEVRPVTKFGQVVGMVTGNGYAIGRPPVTVLHHEDHNGHCWPFAGSQGQVGVALAAPVVITDITIDHVALEVATDIRSAPRQMEVWGLVEGQDNIAKLQEWQAQKAAAAADTISADAELELQEDTSYPDSLPRSPTYIRIAQFTYDIYGPKHIQTFSVDKEIKELGIDLGVVVLVVKNNWGRDDLTCLYRMRVHGQRLNEIPLPRAEDFVSR
ncbi:hypothetical protein EUX98_g6172 [Antrodiella citrinella]|uniref:SUN domain-containing protein n=1 Tax=Antrodiella citrinella TaxID=2447956 RepID=A0A4S4MPM6_9APHY|nr:hypothetical protein EUX98_g6172 [Antrodiella citrinella]